MKIGLKVKLVTVGFLVSVLAGCASVPLDPGAEKVVFTTTSLPKACQSLGQISSTDVNGVTTSYTSHANLMTMEINALKNRARALGGNVVVLTGHHTVYVHGARRQVATHVLDGIAYVCPANVLRRLPNENSADISDAPVKR
ncbi:MAG TPA: DUF4156 domain-containing protein [Gammaproteobacteria bacterium]|nr:DUF4156 domain-containing protein [Gammaproteobacteria bacterium]